MKTHGRCLWERAISCWLREFGRVSCKFSHLQLRRTYASFLPNFQCTFRDISLVVRKSPQRSQQKFLSSSYEERPFHTSYLVGMEIHIFCLTRFLFASVCIIQRRTCDFVLFSFASYYYAMFPRGKRKGNIQ